MARKISLLKDKDEELLKEIFREIDADESGSLSIPEFKRF